MFHNGEDCSYIEHDFSRPDGAALLIDSDRCRVIIIVITVTKTKMTIRETVSVFDGRILPRTDSKGVHLVFVYERRQRRSFQERSLKYAKHHHPYQRYNRNSIGQNRRHEMDKNKENKNTMPRITMTNTVTKMENNHKECMDKMNSC